MVIRGFGCLAAAAALMVVSACSVGQSGQAAPASAGDQEPFGAPAEGPVSAAGDYLAGRFAQDEHDLSAARKFLTAALAHDPDDLEVMQRTYLALAADGNLGDAADVARRLLKYDNEAAVASIIVAEQDAKAGRWGAAASVVDSLPRRGLNTVLVPLVLAWARMGEGQADQALDALAPLAQNSRDLPLHDFHAALICDLAGRADQAEKFYQSTLASPNGHVLRAVEAAAAFYRRHGHADKAATIVEAFRQDHPGSDVPDAGTARPIDSARAGLAEALFGIAGTLREGEAPDLALVFARLSLDLRPDFPLAQMLAADTLDDMGRLSASDQIYSSIAPGSPAYWTAQLRLAGNLDAMDRTDDAVHTLEGLSTVKTERPQALIALGDLYRRHHRWSEAIGAYDRAVEAVGSPQRQDWSLFYARGVALHESNQWPRAEADFLKALDLDPNEPDVLNYLGYSWVEKGEHLDRARDMIEKAVAQRPTDGFIVDSLGWVYFRTGQYAKAVETLERAIELVPDDATVNDHLGDALWAVGRQDEARFQWNRALVFNPEPDLKAELESKLKSGYAVPPPIKPSKDTAAQ